MAEGTGISDVDEIDSKEKLEAYLKDKPVEWSQAIVSRIALRVFPSAIDLTTWSSANRDAAGGEGALFKGYLVALWRTMFVTVNEFSLEKLSPKLASGLIPEFGGRFLQPQSMAFASQVISLAADALFSPENAFHNIKLAAGQIPDTQNVELSTSNSIISAIVAYVAERATFATSHEKVWSQIQCDLKLLENGVKLSTYRLFNFDRNGFISNQTILGSDYEYSKLNSFKNFDGVKDTHFCMISDWYSSLVKSDFSQTPWGLFSNDIDVKNAFKLDVFLVDHPDEVMQEIADIVGWPDYGKPPEDDEIGTLIAEQKYVVASLKHEAERFGHSEIASKLERYYSELTRPRNAFLTGALDMSMTDIQFDDWSAEAFDSGIKGFVVNHKKIMDFFIVESPSKREVLAKLAAMASPEIAIDNQGRIDAKPNAEFDIPVIDDDLINLPQIQISAIDMLLNHLKHNVPQIVKDGLREYRDHLKRNKAQPIPGMLELHGNAVMAEFKSSEGHHWGEGLASYFQSFDANHEKLLKHFPLNQEREELFASIKIDEDKMYEPELIEGFENFFHEVDKLEDEGKATPEFIAVASSMKNQLSYVKTLHPSAPIEKGTISPRQRFVAWTTGTLIQISNAASSVVEFAVFYGAAHSVVQILSKLFI